MREARGSINPLLVSTIVFATLAVIFIALFGWAYGQYQDYKNNTDQKIAVAVEDAKKVQATELEVEFQERYKEPYLVYRGPSDLGSVSFDFPKTWAVYENENTSDSGLDMYLNPKVVGPIDDDNESYSLRVEVKLSPYEQELSQFEGLIQEGKVKATPYETNGYEGVKIAGQIDEEHKGQIVIFKLRGNVLVLTANSSTFFDEFNKVVLASLKFNP